MENQSPEEAIVRGIIRLLLQHAEPMTVSSIYHDFSRIMKEKQFEDMKEKQFEDLLRGYPTHFEILDNGPVTVKLVTSLNYCKMHCSKNGNCPGHAPYCTGLHICKFYMISKCWFKQCYFGHDFNTSHNMRVLKENLLDGLPVELIQRIAERPIPRLCHFYNVESGCRNDAVGKKCPCLHICKDYVMKTCKLGEICRKSHKLMDPTVLSILDKFGIDTKRTPMEILAELNALFQDDDGSDSKGIESAPASLYIRTNPVSASKVQTLCKRDQDQQLQGGAVGQSMPYAGARPKTGPLRLDHSRVNNLTEQLVHLKTSVPHIAPPQSVARGVIPTQGDRHGSRYTNKSEGSRETVKDISQKYVCIYNLVDKCSYGACCFNYHSELPYQWMYKPVGSEDWIEVQRAENLLLELHYCDPYNEDCSLKSATFGRGTSVRLDYKTMTTGGDHVLTFHRLSTDTSVVMDTQPLATKWIWYWFQEGSWTKYGDDDHGYKSSVYSHEIEQAFTNNLEGQLEFSTAGHDYVMNFREMVQCNLHHKTKRDIRRRPEFVDEKELEIRKRQGKRLPRRVGPAGAAVDIPRPPVTWSLSSSDNLINHYRIVQLDKKNPAMRPEYQEIEDFFCKHLSSTVNIKSIERVENGDLWHSYESKKIKMRIKNKNMDVKEECLFHGTKNETVEAICRQGFDFRMSGTMSGAIHGKGSYFANASEYSNHYTEFDTANKMMFVAKVLVGEYAKGEKSYTRPPPKDPSDRTSALYDSCVDNVKTPKIFVIFQLDQVYPEYLIKYEYKY